MKKNSQKKDTQKSQSKKLEKQVFVAGDKVFVNYPEFFETGKVYIVKEKFIGYRDSYQFKDTIYEASEHMLTPATELLKALS